MPKSDPNKRRNVQDSTLKNNRKTRADIKALTARVRVAERQVQSLLKEREQMGQWGNRFENETKREIAALKHEISEIKRTAVMTDLPPRRSKQ